MLLRQVLRHTRQLPQLPVDLTVHLFPQTMELGTTNEVRTVGDAVRTVRDEVRTVRDAVCTVGVLTYIQVAPPRLLVVFHE